MGIDEELQACIGFVWDQGNTDKNLEKHGVADSECEEVFFNDPLMAAEDPEHSAEERRAFVLGQTSLGRRLFVAFTIRHQQIRVISARDMTKQEKERYDR
jgi:uncharacterized protein